MALVFVLAMLALVLTIVLAYFSRAILNRQIASSSVAKTKVQLFSQTAEAFILADILQEIEAGSVADTNTSSSVKIHRPTTLTNVGIGVTTTWAPSMVPQRIGGTGITNIVKISRGGQAFFTNGPGYTGSGLSRASTISTTTPSANRRFLTKDRWNRPKLMADSETNAFIAPDWIYIDRQGNTPANFSAAMASSDSSNPDYVIGRYAYVIYDVGGLIDINVVGNQLAAAENSRRGRLNQVSLASGPLGITDFPDFVTWRSSVSSTNTNSTAGSGGLFDPKRTFIEVPPGEQAFVNRQDLLAYVASTNTISTTSLPFLTTFSRDLNAPSYEPNPTRSKLPVSPDPDLMNPGLLSTRFATDTTLNRPGSDPITVKSGTPVMPRRFPLSKLSLFEEANPDPAAMLYYFGLEKAGDRWRYTKTLTGSRIAKLSEVANEGREPNFFEILQATIYTGSLGKAGPDTFTFEAAEDALQNIQVMQIGANIIDQADANDRPTTIEYPSGVAGEFFTVYGVENLPYISQIGVVGWRPADNRNLFQAWAVFDVWNPHQNAATLPVGVDGFRVVPVSGSGRVNLSYRLSVTGAPQTALATTLANNTPSSGGCVFQSTQTLLTLNAGRDFTFPTTDNYSEPTTLGGTPTSSASTPGLLLAECTPGVAVPAVADRDPLLARTATLEALETALGKTFGIKAYNTFRLRSSPYPSDWRFALQAHYTGDPASTWHTYQNISGLGGPGEQLDSSTSPIFGDLLDEMEANTDHSAGGALQNEYYQWRSRGASVGMVKADPRTNRLGFSGWSQAQRSNVDSQVPRPSVNDFLGYSAKHSPDSLPANLIGDVGGNYINNDFRWAVPGGGGITGLSGNFVLAPGFELMPDFRSSSQKNRYKVPLFGLVSNSPDALDAARPFRYSDPDGVVRPGDGYFGTLPTVPGRMAERPLILNRPFRSVGELGYVFRDLPWKTIDFFSRRSGDLGLLDAFSISETDEDPPLTAGQINLNTRQTTALAAALQNSSKQIDLDNVSVPTAELTAAQAQTIAQAIVDESTARPFTDKGDLVTRVLNSGTGPAPLAGDTSKVARETAVRTLAEIGTTRTWNFLIDLVAQTGRFTAASHSGSDFMVQGEERVWIHVAIDRMTGEILEQRKEVVNE